MRNTKKKLKDSYIEYLDTLRPENDCTEVVFCFKINSKLKEHIKARAYNKRISASKYIESIIKYHVVKDSRNLDPY